MTQLMWPWHAMIKAHKVILSAHSLWINNFEKCLYQSKKEILEPSGKVWYPTRKKYFEGTTLRRKGVQVHLWWVRSRRRRLRFAKEWEREGGGENAGVDAGSPGDNDEQTEETLMADNANVEEEKSLEKFINNCQSKNHYCSKNEEQLKPFMTIQLGPRNWKQKQDYKPNSEIWISLLISIQ